MDPRVKPEGDAWWHNVGTTSLLPPPLWGGPGWGVFALIVLPHWAYR
ncbi:hypothetical protein MNBD_ALPHA12-1382 [hydrothermal vent metagenome]|uniref:Uncharacterized protein n=1 Tax=hydrothermal vent metagenome TaxID=652676 RepID=A0A3B0TRL1_9ZZZZ